MTELFWIQTLLLVLSCISWYYVGKSKADTEATKIFSKSNEDIQKIFYENREKTVKNYESQIEFLNKENKELRNLNEYMIEHFGSKFTFPHDLCTDKNNFGGEGKNGL